MTTIPTAAILIIGDEILSGRTTDSNINTIAKFLGALGIDLREVRVVHDEEAQIVETINALRNAYEYVFTTGGIGPTHDDITADAVAAAHGTTVEVNPTARTLLQERCDRMGVELNENRLRMARQQQHSVTPD